MKKLIYKILIFVILFILLCNSTCFGAHIENYGHLLLGYGDWLNLYFNLIEANIGEQTNQQVLNQLGEDYGYGIYYCTDPNIEKIRISTTVEITKKYDGWLWFSDTYIVKLGNRELPAGYVGGVGADKDGKAKFTKEKLINILGYEEDFGELDVGTSWNVVIDVDMPETVKDAPINTQVGGDNDIYYSYAISAKELWSGQDVTKGDLKDKWHTYPDKTYSADAEYKGGLVEIGEDLLPVIEDTVTGAQEIGEDVVTGFHTIFDFVDDPLKALATIALDLVKTFLGDLPQGLANLFQTGWVHWQVTYDKAQIIKVEETEDSNTEETDAENETDSENSIPQRDVNLPAEPQHTALDEYVDLSDTREYIDQKEITIDETKKDIFKKYGFDRKTKIPVIAVDLYTIAANKVDMTKANFLVKTGNENKVWTTIRDLVASVIHGLMYIIMAFLIIGLIIYGLQIVLRSYKTPQEKIRKIKGMEKFATGLIMLVGTLLIEALCLNASDLILGKIAMQDTYEGPIRVTVKETNYEVSFSTTPTGYYRFMADISNIDLYQTKAVFVFAYVILAIANLLCVVGMCLRMLVMMGLAIFHFWLILKVVLQNNTVNTMEYRKWVTTFALLSLIQVVVAMIARLLLEGIVNI